MLARIVQRSLVLVAMAVAFATGAWAQDFSGNDTFADAQTITLISDCLTKTNEWQGDTAATCLDLVVDPCMKAVGQTSLDTVFCMQVKANVWARMLDHELGAALVWAREVDLWCLTTHDWVCDPTPKIPGQVELSLRRSQRLWIQMLLATCDFAYKKFGNGSGRTTSYAGCVRDLVFERQQFFWVENTQGDGSNVDPALAWLRYDSEVVPFPFRLEEPKDHQP